MGFKSSCSSHSPRGWWDLSWLIIRQNIYNIIGMFMWEGGRHSVSSTNIIANMKMLMHEVDQCHAEHESDSGD